MISTIVPDYPEQARREGIEGDVWVKMRVDTLGRVREAMIARVTNPVLIEPALDAALKTKFKPAMLGGKKVAVWYIAPFHVAAKGD